MGKVSFASRLRELMEVYSLSQTDIVNRIKIPKSSMSQYLSETRFPKIDVIDKLAFAYNVQQAWLLGYDVPMKINSESSKAEITAKIAKDEKMLERITAIYKLSEGDRSILETMIDAFLNGKGVL